MLAVEKLENTMVDQTRLLALKHLVVMQEDTLVKVAKALMVGIT